ncbi:MAG TPA: GtrA family protein [Candidatus Paceibacterota bacterium]|nr:GtrA family protein [Candidatus Paceibacterota bacterium]
MISFFKNIIALATDTLVVRYIFSGGFSSFLDIGLLFVLTEYFHVYYLASAVIALTTSFIVRFLLQKKFTFRDTNTATVHKQLFFYSVLYAVSMVATTGFLYFFVEILHVWYVFAQVLTIGIMAGVSFFAYRYIIFPENVSTRKPI